MYLNDCRLLHPLLKLWGKPWGSRSREKTLIQLPVRKSNYSEPFLIFKGSFPNLQHFLWIPLKLFISDLAVLQRSPSASRCRQRSTRISERPPRWRASESCWLRSPPAEPYLWSRGGGCWRSSRNITPWFSCSISPALSETAEGF